jgi:hypothetical protein
MISIVHWVSAKRRLEEQNKTVHMMGGVAECPPMILAQREMTRHELEYYEERLTRLAYGAVSLTILSLLTYGVFVSLQVFGVI